MTFEGKSVFITGAARGLGFDFGRAFAERGAAVAMVDIDRQGAVDAAATLRAAGATASAIGCDVTNENEVAAAVEETVSRLGSLDILINNAGLHLTHYSRPISELPRSDTRAVFDVNVMGVINCSVAAAEAMRASGGGAIVNISSISGYRCIGPYGITKLAVRGLTVAFAAEFAAAGIRVNGVAPGMIGTDAAIAHIPPDMATQFVNELQLIRRLGQPADVTQAVLFLCSDEASFITGETLRVSGGFPASL